MSHIKPREPRRKVLIDARMHAGGTWRDVKVLNMSSRGLLLRAAVAPPRGSYTEIRRGLHVILARVVWTDGECFGVRTQDRLTIDGLIRNLPPGSAENWQRQSSGVDRDTQWSASTMLRDLGLAHSKSVSRLLQFACIGVFGASAAVAGASWVGQTLGQPMSAITDTVDHAD